MDTDTPKTAIGTDGKNITRLDEATYPENATEDEIKIKQYFLGYSGIGKYLPNLLDIEAVKQAGTVMFKSNDIITDAANSIQIAEEGEGQLKIAYKGYNYIIKFEEINYMTFVTSAAREDRILEEEWGRPENDRYYFAEDNGQIVQFIITETNKVIMGIGTLDEFGIINEGYMYDSIAVTVKGEEKIISNPIFMVMTSYTANGVSQYYQILATLKGDEIVLYSSADDDNISRNDKNEVIGYEYLIEELSETCTLIQSPLKDIKESYIKKNESQFLLDNYNAIRTKI